MEKKYYLVCGSRYWDNGKLIREFIDLIPRRPWVMVEGECIAGGADIIARKIALDDGKLVKAIYAMWKKYGKRAGPIRNTIMVSHNPFFGLAFHNNLRQSKGTKDIINKMMRKNIPVFVITEHQKRIYLNEMKEQIKNILVTNL